MSNVHISAKNALNQMPSFPKKIGSKRIAPVWNKNVLKKEIAAEIFPLFSAVKKEEDIIFIPAGAKASAYKANACVVSNMRFLS